jgi:FkbM family methyltransferase
MSQVFVNEFQRLSSRDFIEQTGFTAMDIGARGGLDTALLPLAWATEMTGFEPDREAAAALVRAESTPWKRSRTIPSAIGGNASMRTLHVPKSLESASLLRHNPEMVDWFGMDEQHGVHRTFSVETDTLDQLQARGLIGPIDYVKIDVEGAEGEILRAAENVLSCCLAIRVEVSFLEQRIGQPLIWEIGGLLQQAGFATLDIIEVQKWRHGYVAAHPYRVHADLVYSKGVVAQADLVCMRDFRTLSDPVAIAKLGLIAAAMGYIDHAQLIFRHHSSLLADTAREFSIDFNADLAALSTRMGKQMPLASMRKSVRDLIPLIRSVIGKLPGRS